FMKHLILCPEYPPAPIPPGGIGVYAVHIAQLLAEHGETVHVIAQLWVGASQPIEEKYQGRLIIHRVPLGDWGTALLTLLKLPLERPSKVVKALSQSRFPGQCFSWQACLLIEKLVEEEGIDLIEAQDYQAPLYYFQLRRALGLGPKRKPPCFLHLHSPTEFIVRHNGWDLALPNFLTAKRLEDFSIATADALLCPSQYFAAQAETHYGLIPGCIQVIPLPIGNTSELERDPAIWRQGKICYIGRLERRKGVLEWIDAAVKVAEKYPEAQFEFIGANCLGTHRVSGSEILERCVPEPLKRQFHFLGKQNRADLLHFLKQARVAVVPSRWENFPNTCIEAMCSGLPVIASSEGGMVEMIQDGQTGWIANTANSDSLAIAIERALKTSPGDLAEMGKQAALTIRQMCNNSKTMQKHLEFRQQLVNQGSKRSLHLPSNLPWAKQPFSKESARRTARETTVKGIAIVVTCFNDGQLLSLCLQNLKHQTQPPTMVIVVDRGSTNGQTLQALNLAEQEGWQVVRNKAGDLVSAKNLGIASLVEAEINSLGLAFLDTKHRLKPDFIATCALVLHQCREVGLVSCWSESASAKGKIWIRPCPSFPYQWLLDESAPFSVIRTEALWEAGKFRSVIEQGYEDWDLFNAVMAAGWAAVTIPENLVEGWAGNEALLTSSVHTFGRMQREILLRFPELVERDAMEIALFVGSNPECSVQQELFTLQGKLEVAELLLQASITDSLFILKKVEESMLKLHGHMKRKAEQILSDLISRVSSIMPTIRKKS
ncbi:MAG: glycosyltransferase, partial [Chroococcidiopsidaceae cyanobacterium CP_BM_RX_35]|nr:glycosyltransferase [Chroococcidiopsidaceae cyanobacterium CP_BM_RX_35]